MDDVFAPSAEHHQPFQCPLTLRLSTSPPLSSLYPATPLLCSLHHLSLHTHTHTYTYTQLVKVAWFSGICGSLCFLRRDSAAFFLHCGGGTISSHPASDSFPCGGIGQINGGFEFLISPFFFLPRTNGKNPHNRAGREDSEVIGNVDGGTDCMLSPWVIASNHRGKRVWCGCVCVCLSYFKSMMRRTGAELHLLKQQYCILPSIL